MLNLPHWGRREARFATRLYSHLLDDLSTFETSTFEMDAPIVRRKADTCGIELGYGTGCEQV